jgi:hypothetical protein
MSNAIRDMAGRVLAGDFDALASLLDTLHDEDRVLWVALACRLGGVYAEVADADELDHVRRPAIVRLSVVKAVRSICWPYIDAPGVVTLLGRIAGQDNGAWERDRKAVLQAEQDAIDAELV